MKKLVNKKFFGAIATFITTALVAIFTLSNSALAATAGSLFFNINASDPGSYSASTPSVWNDLSPSNRAGTINGTLTYNSGNGSLEFPGTSSAYVDMGSGLNNFSSGLTIEFEGHFGAANQAFERIFDFGNGSPSDNIWIGAWCRDALYPECDPDELVIEVFHGTTSKNYCHTTGDALLTGGNAATFAKYVITLDGSLCRIYKNGTEINTTAGYWGTGFTDNPSALGSTYTSLPLDINRTKNYIGKSNWSADPAFNGAIKYVRIYTEAISSSDVSNNAATYTLTYSTSGADNGTAPSAKTGNGLITLAGNTGTLAKAGHVFQGWATSANQTNAISGSYNLTANTTLYPAFLPNTYSVTYEENGGSAVSDGTFSHGGTLTFPTNPTRTGYTFLGWFANATSGTALSASTVASGNTNVTLHAQWTAVTNNSVNTPVTSSTGSVTTSATLAKTGVETSTMVLISIILLGIGLGLTQFRRLENR